MKTTYYTSEDGSFEVVRYRDIDGNPVERTPDDYPYNYDEYVQYNNDYKKSDPIAYSDRIRQWDWNLEEICCKKIFGNNGQYFGQRNPDDIEKYLSLYFDKEVELTLIMEGCNWSNGFPYWLFGFRDKENEHE